MESSIVAGEGVHVQALNSQLNSGTPLNARYAWDFGDPGSEYNDLVGFNAGHIYQNPGTYTITLTLTNSNGNTDVAKATVNVASDNRKIYYVSTSGSDSNSGSSPSDPIQSVNKVISILGGAAGTTSNVEFRFEDGDTFNMSTGIVVAGNNVLFTDYGSGSAPVLNWDGEMAYVALIGTRPTSHDVTAEHLIFRTVFGGTGKTNMPDTFQAAGTNLVVTHDEFENVGYGVNGNGNPTGVIVQKNDVPTNTDLRSYFVWVAGSDFVVLGNTVPNSTNEAILRVVNGTRVLIGYNTFTNEALGGDDTAKNTLTIHEGSYAYIVGNTLNDGPMHIGPLGEQDGLKDKAARWNYAVVEGNLLNTESFTLHGAQHVMYRDNISTTNGYPAYNIEAYNTEYQRGVVDATYVNNTAINNSTQGIMFLIGGPADGLTLENNLYVAPKLIPGGDGAASPVYVTDSSLDSFDLITNNVWAAGNPSVYTNGGINYIYPDGTKAIGFQTPAEWNAYSQVGTDIFADVSLNGFTPSSSSAAANAGTQVDGVFYDYYGNARPRSGPIIAGAVQV